MKNIIKNYNLDSFDVVIVSDYNKGLINKSELKKIKLNEAKTNNSVITPKN